MLLRLLYYYCRNVLLLTYLSQYWILLKEYGEHPSHVIDSKQWHRDEATVNFVLKEVRVLSILRYYHFPLQAYLKPIRVSDPAVRACVCVLPDAATQPQRAAAATEAAVVAQPRVTGDATKEDAWTQVGHHTQAAVAEASTQTSAPVVGVFHDRVPQRHSTRLGRRITGSRSHRAM